jgi:GT2 family glycosyltransferase
MTTDFGSVGVVVIGRNEGERLKQCLESVNRFVCNVVYVDSGSTDGSVAEARARGIEVVELDMGKPFTAARARNAGFFHLCGVAPELAYVQFVDGDCELDASWLEQASEFLDKHEDVAAVAGRLRERFPARSVYNMLCDIEWDGPAGEARFCGGIAMIRVDAFSRVSGFRPDLIAGEEPELCVRLRASGWLIWRLSAEMGWHDAAMLRFGQWWKRTLRAGFAFAQAAYLHGAPPERQGIRESRSAWLWGFFIPVTITLLAQMWLIPALILVLIYPLQIVRLAWKGSRSPRENWLRAGFLILGKFPEVVGQIKFLSHRISRVQSRLIEYK